MTGGSDNAFDRIEQMWDWRLVHRSSREAKA